MAKPTLTDLMEARGVPPVRLAADARVSLATVLRARKGTVPGPLLLSAMATALGVDEAVLRASIVRGLEKCGSYRAARRAS